MIRPDKVRSLQEVVSLWTLGPVVSQEALPDGGWRVVLDDGRGKRLVQRGLKIGDTLYLCRGTSPSEEGVRCLQQACDSVSPSPRAP